MQHIFIHYFSPSEHPAANWSSLIITQNSPKKEISLFYACHLGVRVFWPHLALLPLGITWALHLSLSPSSASFELLYLILLCFIPSYLSINRRFLFPFHQPQMPHTRLLLLQPAHHASKAIWSAVTADKAMPQHPWSAWNNPSPISSAPAAQA